jgi:hypothetical protein
MSSSKIVEKLEDKFEKQGLKFLKNLRGVLEEKQKTSRKIVNKSLIEHNNYT